MQQEDSIFTIQLEQDAVEQGLPESVTYNQHFAPVLCYLVLTENKRVLSYDQSGSLHLWSLETTEKLAEFPIAEREVYFVSKDGNWLVTQLLTDCGNGQQEEVDVQYIGNDPRYKIFTRLYIYQITSVGLNLFFNEDCTELWVEDEWDDGNGVFCTRCYTLDPQYKDLPIKHEYHGDECPEDMPDTEATTLGFTAV